MALPQLTKTRRGGLWVGLIVGLAFLYLAFRGTEPGKIWGVLRTALLVPLIASVGLRLTSLWMRAMRWRSILKPLRTMTPGRAFRLVSLGEFANEFLPARGGELVRIWLVSKDPSVSRPAALASVFLEKLYDLGVILVFLISTSFLVPALPVALPVGWILLSVVILVVLLGMFVRNLNLFRAKLPFEQLVTRFHDGLRILQSTGQALRLLAASFFLWGISGLAVWLVLLALELPLPWYTGLFLLAVSAMGSLVPAAPGGLGPIEFLYVVSLHPFGVDKNVALACALLARGLHFLSLSLAGIPSYFHKDTRSLGVKTT